MRGEIVSESSLSESHEALPLSAGDESEQDVLEESLGTAMVGKWSLPSKRPLYGLVSEPVEADEDEDA